MDQVFRSRTIQSIIFGAYLGAMKYAKDNDIDINLDALTDILKCMKLHLRVDFKTINSIVMQRDSMSDDETKDAYYRGAHNILLSTPLSFADIFGYPVKNLDTLVDETYAIFNVRDFTPENAKSYVELLHDILWDKISRDDIFKILPELKMTFEELNDRRNDIEKKEHYDTLFSGLWSFMATTDFKNSYYLASCIHDTDPYICGVACALAACWYGESCIPKRWVDIYIKPNEFIYSMFKEYGYED